MTELFFTGFPPAARMTGVLVPAFSDPDGVGGAVGMTG